MSEDINKAADFLDIAIRLLGGFSLPSHTKVLDFGCGSGQLVDALLQLGFDAYGCDISAYWSGEPSVAPERLHLISSMPYRLPFDDSIFDVVVSTSVLEHAQNKEEYFQDYLYESLVIALGQCGSTSTTHMACSCVFLEDFLSRNFPDSSQESLEWLS